jgi:WD40 repeat protein
MSAIFLSHSSADNAQAEAIKKSLEAHGHTVFLDLDPETGIPGGSTWERVLSDRIHVCQAVVPLLSPDWIESRWCIAELFHARAIGKAIVPITIRAHGEARWLAHLQQIDLTRDRDQGVSRLLRALEDVHPLMPGRLPYPGLATYTEDDAAVFFGREPETAAGLERLESLRRRGRSAPRLLVVLGASGSGKSSLVRAGFIARLRRRDSEWFVLPVVRPRASPIDELASVLAAAHLVAGRTLERTALARQLEESARATGSGTSLLDNVRDLRIAARRLNATVLLVIDQFEELFTASTAGEADACLELLRNAMMQADDELIVLATMRSDFLGAFQQHPFLAEDESKRVLAYEELTIDPLPASRLEDVIAGPASRFGVDVQRDLVSRLIADVHTTMAGATNDSTGLLRGRQAADALPLLAFTLHRLWIDEQEHPDGHLDVRDYERAGALKGTIEEAVRLALTLTTETEALLRAAIIPAMVQINADGTLTRRRALFDNTPPESRPYLERLVEIARILVIDRDHEGRRTIEVAHEAVFRLWSTLAQWLDQDANKLRALESVRRAAGEWNASRRPDLLVHRDGRLSEVRVMLDGWIASAVANPLEPSEQQYVDACVQAQRARDEAVQRERERRLQDAKTIWRRTAIGLGVAVVAIVLAVAVLWLSGSLVRIQATTRDGQRLALAKVWVAQDPTIAGLVLNAIKEPQNLSALDLDAVALNVLAQPASWTELKHDGPVRWVDVSRDGKTIVTASADKTARIWNADGTGAPQTLPHPEEVVSAIFSPDSTRVVTSALDGSVRVWRRGSSAPPVALDHGRSVVVGLAFSDDGSLLLTGAADGSVRIWSAQPPFERMSEYSLAGDSKQQDADRSAQVRFVTFDSGHSRWLAATDNRVWVRRLDASASDGAVGCTLDARVLAAAFGSENRWIEVVTREGFLYRFAPDSMRQGTPCAEQAWASFGPIDHAAFSPTGETLATTRANGVADLWQIERPSKPVTLAGHTRGIAHAAISESGTIVATASDDDTARVWRVQREPADGLIVIRHDRNVSDVAFTADGQRVVSASNRGDVQLSSLDGMTRDDWKFSHSQTGAMEAALGPDGEWLLSVATNGDARVWSANVPRAKRRSRLLRDPQDPDSKVRHARFDVSGRRVVTASADGIARIWQLDQEDAEPIRLVGHDRGLPLTVAIFNRTGDRVLTASADGTARLWDSATGGAITSFAHGAGVVVNDAAFNGDGTRIVTGASDALVRVWPIEGDSPVVFRHPRSVGIVAFSPDGNSVLTACDDGVARIWPLGRSGAVAQLTGNDPDRSIVTAVFSQDGSRVLTASQDGTARVWRADGVGDPIVLRHPAALTRAAFNTAGDAVITGSSDSRARIWTLSPVGLLDIIRSRTRTCLTPDFRVRYFLESGQEAAAAGRVCESARPAHLPS